MGIRKRDVVQGRYAKLFGIDDALLGAGVGLFGGVLNNLFAGQRQDEANQFNAQQAMMSAAINAQQAQLNRDWSAGQAGITRDYNAEQAQIGRDFSRSEAFNAFSRNIDAMREQTSYSSAQAQAARDWAQSMSSTAYQRTMADMKAAGLNPILAYRQGGSGTPGASMGSAGSASSPMASAPVASASIPGGGGAASAPLAGAAHAAQVFDILQPAISTAMNVSRLESDLKTAGEERRRIGAQTVEHQAGAAQKLADSGLKSTQDILTKTELPKAKVQEEYYQSEIGKWLTKFGLGGQNVGQILSGLPKVGIGGGFDDKGTSFKDRWHLRSD